MGGSAAQYGRERRSHPVESPLTPILLCALCALCSEFSPSARVGGEGPDFLLPSLDEREPLLHFLGEPALGRVEVVARGGLVGAVAREEGPVLRPAVVEPEAVLGADGVIQPILLSREAKIEG